jgi:hypothetical protein
MHGQCSAGVLLQVDARAVQCWCAAAGRCKGSAVLVCCCRQMHGQCSAGVVLQAICTQCAGSSGSIVTGPRTEHTQCGFNSYQRKKCLSVRRTVKNSPRTQPGSYPMDIEGCPLRFNWSEREATHFNLVPKVPTRPKYTSIHNPRPTNACTASH